MTTYLRTNNDARAALGKVSEVLAQGYDVASTIGSRALVGGDDTQFASLELLDQVNDYAQRLYASFPANNAPISDFMTKKLQLCQKQAQQAAKQVGISASALDWTVVELVSETSRAAGSIVNDAASIVGKTAGGIAGGLFSGLGLVLTVVILLVVLIFVFGINPLKFLRK